MSVIRKPAILIVVLFTSTLWSTAEESPTAVLHCTFQVSSPIDFSALHILGAQLTSYEERSLSSVIVQNTSGKPLESVLLLIDFADHSGSHMETGLYYATTHRFNDRPLGVQRGYGIQRLMDVVEPTKELGLNAVSDVVPLSCAAKAVLSKAMVRFSDGSTSSQSSPRWMTDPVIREATVSMMGYPNPVPSVFLADVDVNHTGHASVVQTEGSDIKVLKWLQRQLDSWSISPGDKGPLANDRQRLRMVVRVGLQSAGRSEFHRKWMMDHVHNGSVVVVNISPSRTASDSRLPVIIGGMIASQRALSIHPE